ncbi:MAG: hypothetical protein Q8P41_16105 [Pseudomonadota bacterium]|nr:hypothetical protein [Pseudomonadota bacterium]
MLPDDAAAVVGSATHAWDADGNEVRREEHADGEPSFESVWTWDDEGRMLTGTHGLLGGDTYGEETYVYDGDLLVEETHLYALYPEANRHAWYTYDADGQLVLTEGDDGADGTIDGTIAGIWEAGHLVRSERDTGADGTLDDITLNTWALGRLVRTGHDNGADGTIDSTCDTTWALLDEGEVATMACSDADRSTGSTQITTTDAHGQTVSVLYDWDDDAVIDGVLTYERDEQCLLLETRGEQLSGDRYTQGVEYDHDTLGRVTLEAAYVSMVDNDGMTLSQEERSTWTYTCPTP